MARKRLEGVGGVLDQLISAEQPDKTRQPAEQTACDGSDDGDRSQKPPRALPKTRLGRPPGRRSNHPTDKVNTSVRLSADIIAEYREWSWDERCQLGELIERALQDYRDRHHRRN